MIMYMKERQKDRKTVVIGAFKIASFWGIIAGCVGAGVLLLWIATLSAPDLTSFETRRVAQSTKILDRTGEILLYELNADTSRTIIGFDDISVHIKNAAVAIEDSRFYEHPGVEPLAFLRAALVNLKNRSFSQGGSTITQQVIKNSVLSQEKKISRKIKEWVLAVKLEREYTKEEILTFYLNESPYGGNVYGVEEASLRFFNKSASELTLAEAAYLAALPQAPTFYSPYGNNRDALERRKNLVLSEMLRNGFITESEHDSAREAEVTFVPRAVSGIQAPHFVFFIQEILEKKYGQRGIEERGLRIITSLDFDLQQTAEEIVERYALENATRFNAENASLVAINPKTGEILVMVGSRNYFDERIDGNFNIALAHRQPGSAFKPFAYAEALRKGYTAETAIFDVRTQFSTSCGTENLTSEDGCYSPGNYDDTFRGPMTFRTALAQSVNVPAVKVLYLAGIGDTLRLARSMGIESLTNVAQYGLTLVLGGGEVSLLDMTSAYGVFANEGVRNPYVGILRVEDAQGNIIDEFSPRGNQVLEGEVARSISDILSDNVARTPAFGANSFLNFPGRDVAVKTGTTNEYKDAWIVGYTPAIAVGAWAGNNNNTSMEKRVAGFIIAPLWHEFMQTALSETSAESFTRPQPIDPSLKPILRGIWRGGETYLVDSRTNTRANASTPEEFIMERAVTDIHSILHWVSKDNPQGPPPSNPQSDGQYIFWERGVERWRVANGLQNDTTFSLPGSGGDGSGNGDESVSQTPPTIIITSPTPNQIFTKSSQVAVSAEVETESPVSEVRFFLNDVHIGSSNDAPYYLAFTPEFMEATKSQNTLRATAIQNGQSRASAEVSFSVSDL